MSRSHPEAVTIRRLDPADLDAYFTLRLRALTECPAAYATDADAWTAAPTATIEAHLHSTDPILGAWFGSDLVGPLGLSREARPSVAHKAGLWGFYVVPDARRRGVGTAMVDEMLAIARQNGIRQLRATVATSSIEALALLQRLRFEEFGVEREARLVDGVFHDQVYLVRPTAPGT